MKLTIVKKLCKKYEKSKDKTNDLIRKLCRKGKYNAIKWMYTENKIDKNLLVEDEYIFISCCVSGNLNLAKLLLEINPNINLEANDNVAFDIICENGLLKFAKWMISKNPNMFSTPNTEKNIGLYNSTALINSCKNGHFKMVKWLLTIRLHIFIENDFNEGFYEACVNGHLKLAQWLYKKSPYPIKDLLHVFIHSVSYCKLDVAEWLFGFNKELIISLAGSNECGYIFVLSMLENKLKCNSKETIMKILEWYRKMDIQIDYRFLYKLCEEKSIDID